MVWHLYPFLRPSARCEVSGHVESWLNVLGTLLPYPGLFDTMWTVYMLVVVRSCPPPFVARQAFQSSVAPMPMCTI